jgi:hypothetical protein
MQGQVGARTGEGHRHALQHLRTRLHASRLSTSRDCMQVDSALSHNSEDRALSVRFSQHMQQSGAVTYTTTIHVTRDTSRARRTGLARRRHINDKAGKLSQIKRTKIQIAIRRGRASRHSSVAKPYGRTSARCETCPVWSRLWNAEEAGRPLGVVPHHQRHHKTAAHSASQRLVVPLANWPTREYRRDILTRRCASLLPSGYSGGSSLSPSAGSTSSSSLGM